MTPFLDTRTIDRLVQIIVDPDGPQERSGRALADLLRRSGWPDPPEYEGWPRVPWLTDVIGERMDDEAAIGRLLCRVCDPIEYDGGAAVAESFGHAINGILAPERMAITYQSGRPVLGRLNGGQTTMFSVPSQLEQRLANLLSDANVVAVLYDRARQSQASTDTGAHLLAIFGIGSFVEGLLYAVLTERHPELAKQFGNNISLARLIDVAHDEGLIQLDAKNFLHDVRDFRNYIHPRYQLERRFAPDVDTVRLCWGPVHAILNDLEASAAAM
jgi:hypothetical protein